MTKEKTGEADEQVDLDAESFFADIVAQLAQNLEETVGLEDAASFIAAVGGKLGDEISRKYPPSGDPEADRALVATEIADICIDLKARIGGDFYVERIEDERIILRNRRCPFGDRVKGKPSLCMMTTNVFGRVAADRSGFASVHVEEAIAAGDPGCRVSVRLVRDDRGIGHDFFA